VAVFLLLWSTSKPLLGNYCLSRVANKAVYLTGFRWWELLLTGRAEIITFLLFSHPLVVTNRYKVCVIIITCYCVWPMGSWVNHHLLQKKIPANFLLIDHCSVNNKMLNLDCSKLRKGGTRAGTGMNNWSNDWIAQKILQACFRLCPNSFLLN
jgi:hypothetical protein